LYLFVSYLLQLAINEFLQLGRLSSPIETNNVDCPAIQYADDTLLILSKDVLHKFSRSTCLRIHFDKSQMIPISVNEDVLNPLVDDFGCQMGKMPFTFLGLPLGTTRPSIFEHSPLVCRLERKLTASSSFLSQGVMLQIINFALASMPLHF
jgi:hypothetical protein